VFATAVAAQAPARILLGQRVAGAAAGEGGDFYAYVGLQGTRLKAQLSLPGLGAVTLYGADGTELARTEGTDNVTLAHTLDDDGIYLLGVTRGGKGAAYTLALEGQVPVIAFVYEDDAKAVAGDATKVAPATPAGPPPFVADPAVWGVYARLAGRTSVKKDHSYYLSWVWQRPGEVLVEEWRGPSDTVAFTNTITPTGTPGRLHQQSSYLGNKQWDGVITKDGGVAYVGRGILKMPYRLSLTADEVLEMRRVKVQGDEVTVTPGGALSVWPLVPTRQ